MAHVSEAPVTTLPGHVTKSPAGQLCDLCDLETDATQRVQGETDSMGAEYDDYCDFHASIDLQNRKDAAAERGICNWCEREDYLTPARDSDEGSSGRLYDLCNSCIRKNKAS